jgi:hypothetical protein
MRILSKIVLLLFCICYINISSTNVSAAERTDKILTLNVNSSSTELQKLLDYNQNNQYNLTVKIPEGQYYLYKELRVYSYTTIIADDKAKFLKNHDRGAMITNDLTNDKGGYTTASDITITGGIWDSSKATKGSESFRFIHASNITIQKATICNVPEGSKLILLAGVKNAKVDHCTLFGYKGTTLKEAIQLDIVHDEVLVPSMQLEELQYDDLACDGISITNNEIFDYPRAIGSHTSIKGVFHKNITISGNNIHDIDEAAIKAYNYVNVQISNNSIKSASAGVLIYTYIDSEKGHYLDSLPGTVRESLPTDYNITIEGNIIDSIQQYSSGKSLLWGDGIRIMGSKERPLSGVSIKKNKITGTKRMGIYSSDAPESYIGSNIISKTANHGIYVDKSYHSKVYYNKLYWSGKAGSTYGGIGISAASKSVVYKNVVKYAAKNGVFLYNGSTNCSISTNTIIGSSDNGIAINLNSNYANISYNKITGKSESKLNNRGIFVYGANYATIHSNTITECRTKQEINTYNSIGSKVYKNTIN